MSGATPGGWRNPRDHRQEGAVGLGETVFVVRTRLRSYLSYINPLAVCDRAANSNCSSTSVFGVAHARSVQRSGKRRTGALTGDPATPGLFSAAAVLIISRCLRGTEVDLV